MGEPAGATLTLWFPEGETRTVSGEELRAGEECGEEVGEGVRARGETGT